MNGSGERKEALETTAAERVAVGEVGAEKKWHLFVAGRARPAG